MTLVVVDAKVQATNDTSASFVGKRQQVGNRELQSGSFGDGPTALPAGGGDFRGTSSSISSVIHYCKGWVVFFGFTIEGGQEVDVHHPNLSRRLISEKSGRDLLGCSRVVIITVAASLWRAVCPGHDRRLLRVFFGSIAIFRFRLKPTNSASVVRQIPKDRRRRFWGDAP